MKTIKLIKLMISDLENLLQDSFNKHEDVDFYLSLYYYFACPIFAIVNFITWLFFTDVSTSFMLFLFLLCAVSVLPMVLATLIVIIVLPLEAIEKCYNYYKKLNSRLDEV
jgi:hypothetical protein